MSTDILGGQAADPQGGGATTPTTLRTMGVEEEYLVVDPGTGLPVPLGPRIAPDSPVVLARPAKDGLPHVPATLSTELQQEQVEIGTQSTSSLADLADDLRELRREAADRAAAVGARVAALGTSPIHVDCVQTADPRYEAIASHLAVTAEQQLTSGCHVHVGVESDEEGVGVLDRMRPWLPVLLALSANSPFHEARDTGYSSYRTQIFGRWPSTGPSDLFGSAAAYHRYVESALRTGALLDPGMIYFDARLSHHYPTVEVRVADVCLDVADTVTLAGLCRALVDTAAREWRTGVLPDLVPTAALRLASWRASRWGLADDVVDPLDGNLRSPVVVAEHLLDHVRRSLRESGDLDVVERGVEAILTRGNGADRQRAVAVDTGDLGAVVRDAVDRTVA